MLVGRGLSNAQIAQELHLSPSTVKRHLANVYQKVGVRSRSEAVRMALHEQWIGLTEITEAAPLPGWPETGRRPGRLSAALFTGVRGETV